MRALVGPAPEFDARVAVVRRAFWEAVLLAAVALINVGSDYVHRWLAPTGLSSVEYRTFQLAGLVCSVGAYVEHLVHVWPRVRQRLGRHTK